MYFNVDHNCFVNHLYLKTQIICKKGATCKRKQGDYNFALESREGDFSWYRVIPSPGLVSPGCCWDPVFIPPQTRTWFLMSYVVVFFMFNKLRWEVIVHIVDIGGIAEHHFLNFLFIIIWLPWYICIAEILLKVAWNKINHNHMEI
jgi:hypothetical protein